MRTKQHAVLILVVTALGLGGSPAAWAQDPIHKAGRGVVNVLTGWIEIPKQINLGSQDPNTIVGFSRGFFKGAALAILRTGVGFFEALTFPFAYPKAFASPYEPLELPDYAWE